MAGHQPSWYPSPKATACRLVSRACGLTIVLWTCEFPYSLKTLTESIQSKYFSFYKFYEECFLKLEPLQKTRGYV